MIGTLVKKNSFGGETHNIKFDAVFRIQVDDDTKGNFIVKTYRRGIFRDKLLYSFTYEANWKPLIPLMIRKLEDYSNHYEKQGFTHSYWNNQIEYCLTHLSN